MGVDAKVYELDEMPNGGEIQAALAEMTGQRTVPNTFVAGKYLGGNDVAQKAASTGKLKELLGM
jgi:glutaredoxin 3